MTKPRVVLTAFEPFGDKTINRSSSIMKWLERSQILLEHLVVSFLEIPVVQDEPSRIMAATFEAGPWDYILSLGEGDREGLCLLAEHTAVNRRDYRIPDNSGNQPRDEPIDRDGPLEYAATFPYDSIKGAATGSHVVVHASNSAGQFLCNELFYTSLRLAHVRNLSTKIGFIHVPAEADDEDETEAMARVIGRGLIDLY